MVRFVVIFFAVLVLGMALMAGLLAQNGYSLFAPEMRMMMLVCVLVAAYVAWRISTILKRRKEDAADLHDRGEPQKRSGGSLGGLLGGKSKSQLEREARVAARRRKLIAEGKLEPEPQDTDTPEPETPAEQPVRAAPGASVKEKMAARAERVRRAREEGKI